MSNNFRDNLTDLNDLILLHILESRLCSHLLLGYIKVE